MAALDPNQLSLFDLFPPIGQEEDGNERNADTSFVSKAGLERKKKEARRNRELLKGLPVVEVVIEPEQVDTDLYRRIGEERTRTLEFEAGRRYVKETVRPPIWTERQSESSQGR